MITSNWKLTWYAGILNIFVGFFSLWMAWSNGQTATRISAIVSLAAGIGFILTAKKKSRDEVWKKLTSNYE